MTTGQGVMLATALLNMAAGGYMTFVQGESVGAVFLGVGATFAALSNVVGKKKNGQEDTSDAG